CKSVVVFSLNFVVMLLAVLVNNTVVERGLQNIAPYVLSLTSRLQNFLPPSVSSLTSRLQNVLRPGVLSWLCRPLFRVYVGSWLLPLVSVGFLALVHQVSNIGGEGLFALLRLEE